MIVIRLTRVGKKNSPSYRVVAADKQKAVKRKFIEILGHYNPTNQPKELVINKERALFWITKGAQPSDTVNNLMCDLGILPKNKKIQKIYGKAQTKKSLKESAGKPAAQPAVDANENVVPGPAEETAPESAEEKVIDTANIPENTDKESFDIEKIEGKVPEAEKEMVKEEQSK